MKNSFNEKKNYHMTITSDALVTCEQLAQGLYSAVRWPGLEPVTC